MKTAHNLPFYYCIYLHLTCDVSKFNIHLKKGEQYPLDQNIRHEDETDYHFIAVQGANEGSLATIGLGPKQGYPIIKMLMPKYKIDDVLIRRKDSINSKPSKVMSYNLYDGNIGYVDYNGYFMEEKHYRLATANEITPARKKKKSKRILKSHPLESKSKQKKLTKVISNLVNIHDVMEDGPYHHDKPKTKKDHILAFLKDTPAKTYAKERVPSAAAHHAYRRAQLYPKVSLAYFEKVFDENIKISKTVVKPTTKAEAIRVFLTKSTMTRYLNTSEPVAIAFEAFNKSHLYVDVSYSYFTRIFELQNIKHNKN